MIKKKKIRRDDDGGSEAPRRSSMNREGGRREVKSALDRANRRGSEGATHLKMIPGTKFLRIKQECTLTLAIIPYEAKLNSKYAKKGDLVYERTFHVHRNVGPEEERHICPRLTAGKECPICDYTAKQMAKGADKKTLDAYKPQERQLFRVLNLKDKDSGIQILDQSYFCFGALLDQRIRSDRDLDREERQGWHKFHSLDTDGFNLRVTFGEVPLGDKKGNYIKATSIDFVPRQKALPDSLIDEGPNLDDLLNIESYEALKKAFYAGSDDDSDDGEDDDSDESEDTDSEGEDDEEEWDEEEETPKTQKKKTRRE